MKLHTKIFTGGLRNIPDTLKQRREISRVTGGKGIFSPPDWCWRSLRPTSCFPSSWAGSTSAFGFTSRSFLVPILLGWSGSGGIAIFMLQWPWPNVFLGNRYGLPHSMARRFCIQLVDVQNFREPRTAANPCADVHRLLWFFKSRECQSRK